MAIFYYMNTTKYGLNHLPIPMESLTRTTVFRHRRIILFPLPFQGHLNPMLQLANLLYSKGFNITIIHTNFNQPKTSNYPHFTFKSILDNDPQDERFSKLPSQGLDSFSRVILINQYGAETLRDELKLLLGTEKDEHVSCLITDALWHFSQSVADSLNLPRLVLRTSSLFCVLVYASMQLFSDHGYFELDDTHLEEQLVEFPMLKVKDIVKMGFKSNKLDPGAEVIISDMIKQSKASSGIIWNSIKELEKTELETMLHVFPVPSFLIPFSKHFTSTSSSLIEPDRTFFSWLDNQPPNSVLYVSFGSVAQVEEKDLLEIAHGLVDSLQYFIWVVRPGFVKGSKWIESLPNGLVNGRGRIVKWVPQQEVLAHKAIGAFWTHCGWNSTMESVSEGVPMICSPFWGDQPLNARYICDVLKVGVHLENEWQREKISSGIRKVMVDEEGKEIRERVGVLKQKLHVSSTKGGSSYESLESLVNYISSF